MPDFDAAAGYWDREIIEQTHVSWMANPQVRDYINEMISGTPAMWPLDWFESVTKGRRFRRALSIGCGTGGMERDLVRRGVAATVDAFDGSVHSLYLARTAADAEGMGKAIRYFAADFNAPKLPRGTYDLVIFHQSLHHVGKLEKLLREVLLSMVPGALLYIDEFVGPSRHTWKESDIAPHQAMWQLVPENVRYVRELPLPINWEDPSEGIRSGEIVEQLAVGFRTVVERDYGGTLLATLFPAIHWPAAPPDLVGKLIESERSLLKTGFISYCKVGVLEPKRGLSKQIARLQYFFVPIMKRIAFVVRARLARR
jgi:SAM-dependent methyltransferase